MDELTCHFDGRRQQASAVSPQIQDDPLRSGFHLLLDHAAQLSCGLRVEVRHADVHEIRPRLASEGYAGQWDDRTPNLDDLGVDLSESLDQQARDAVFRTPNLGNCFQSCKSRQTLAVHLENDVSRFDPCHVGGAAVHRGNDHEVAPSVHFDIRANTLKLALEHIPKLSRQHFRADVCRLRILQNARDPANRVFRGHLGIELVTVDIITV